MRQSLKERFAHPFPESVWPDDEPAAGRSADAGYNADTGYSALEPGQHSIPYQEEVHQRPQVHQPQAHQPAAHQMTPPAPAPRPTPHFFWNDTPCNENHAEAGRGVQPLRRTQATESPRDPRFEMPAWFDDGEGQRTDRRRAMAIAAALTVSCGVGLGIVLLQLQDAAGPRPAVAATHQMQTIKPVTPAEAQKPVQARIDSGTATYTAALPQPPATATATSTVTVETAPKANVNTTRKAAPAPAVKRQVLDPRAPDLRQRAGERLMIGDIPGARAFFLKAVQFGDAGSAFQLARTYDPEVLGGMDVIGPQPDPRLALHWYEQAASGGYEAAILRLEQLRSRARQATN